MHTENANTFWVQFLNTVFVKTQGKKYSPLRTWQRCLLSSCKAKKKNQDSAFLWDSTYLLRYYYIKILRNSNLSALPNCFPARFTFRPLFWVRELYSYSSFSFQETKPHIFICMWLFICDNSKSTNHTTVCISYRISCLQHNKNKCLVCLGIKNTLSVILTPAMPAEPTLLRT